MVVTQTLTPFCYTKKMLTLVTVTSYFEDKPLVVLHPLFVVVVDVVYSTKAQMVSPIAEANSRVVSKPKYMFEFRP